MADWTLLSSRMLMSGKKLSEVWYRSKARVNASLIPFLMSRS